MASSFLRRMAPTTRQLFVTGRQLSTSAQRTSSKADIVAFYPPDKFDQHYVDLFNRTDMDGWEVRRILTELHHHDVIPDPKIVKSALRACKRINDYALAIRFLESIKIKCGPKKNIQTIYPYILQQCKDVLDELGISTPEEMGYDKPELWIPEPDKWWEKSWYKDYGTNKLHGYEEFR